MKLRLSLFALVAIFVLLSGCGEVDNSAISNEPEDTVPVSAEDTIDKALGLSPTPPKNAPADIPFLTTGRSYSWYSGSSGSNFLGNGGFKIKATDIGPCAEQEKALLAGGWVTNKGYGMVSKKADYVSLAFDKDGNWLQLSCSLNASDGSVRISFMEQKCSKTDYCN